MARHCARVSFIVDHRGPFHAIGSEGPLVIALMIRPIDRAVTAELGRVLQRTLAAHDNHLAYLHVTSLESGGAADIAEVRTHYGTLVQRFTNAEGAIALVAENDGFTGALVRSGFTAVMAMTARSTLPGKAFAQVGAATHWLRVAALDRGVSSLPSSSEIADRVSELRRFPGAL
jgi:hypothetical protein